MRNWVMPLAVLGCTLLIAVTWALTRVASWIVFHNHVWEEMDAHGAGWEHWIAEIFHIARWTYLPVAEALVCIAFLFALRRELLRSKG